MRISDWSSDVCSSDLTLEQGGFTRTQKPGKYGYRNLFVCLNSGFHLLPREREPEISLPSGKACLGEVISIGSADILNVRLHHTIRVRPNICCLFVCVPQFAHRSRSLVS